MDYRPRLLPDICIGVENEMSLICLKGLPLIGHMI